MRQHQARSVKSVEKTMKKKIEGSTHDLSKTLSDFKIKTITEEELAEVRKDLADLRDKQSDTRQKLSICMAI